ncbi:MAG TPA: hypothetical protein VHC86_15790, partial [Opitutaceae bacterium]|nr:hypothetical protein [Opitutaceae bacterium]
MNRNSRLQLAGALALAFASFSTAFGQAAPSSPPAPSTTTTTATATPSSDQLVKMQAYVVNGQEASLASAQQIKEESSSIVDSIVASDIDKLPDVNAAYAL